MGGTSLAPTLIEPTARGINAQNNTFSYANRAAGRGAELAAVGRLSSGKLLRASARPRVFCDPKLGGIDRCNATVQVSNHRARRRKAAQPHHHTRCAQAEDRAGVLHTVVR